MKLKKYLIFLTFLMFMISTISLVSADNKDLSSVTINYTVTDMVGGSISNGNFTGNTSVVNLGTRYAHVIQSIGYVDSSGNSAFTPGGAQNCNESVRLHYGNGNTNTLSSFTIVNTTSDGSTNGAVSYNVDGNQAFIEFKPNFNSSLSNCTYSSITLGFSGGIADLSGLPQVGSDVGSFLTNLAPGVGAFIIIMGVFAGVSGIVFAIVLVVRRRIGGDGGGGDK